MTVVGAGVIILSATWGAALLFSCLAAKSDSIRKLIPAALGVALALTLVLILIPRESEEEETESQDQDTTVISRSVMIILESLSLAGGLVAIFVLYCMEQIQGGRDTT
eukprot:m.214586 g.214586  ORF g.214586 m.214586 type:complete len:108 (+) comp39811_c0_seq9:235-558(+)